MRATTFQYGEQEASLNEPIKSLKEQICKNRDHMFISRQDTQDYYSMAALNRENGQ